jgi:large subunit ribosomal protein L28
MAMCSVCGKNTQFGHNVSHSMRATRRRFEPNIQQVTILENGRRKRVHMCTKCLKASSRA